MAVAMTLRDYLADNHIDYDLITHEPTASATYSAQAGHVPGGQFAKAVILKHEHGYVMAVLSANDHVHVGRLGQCLVLTCGGGRVVIQDWDESRTYPRPLGG